MRNTPKNGGHTEWTPGYSNPEEISGHIDVDGEKLADDVRYEKTDGSSEVSEDAGQFFAEFEEAIFEGEEEQEFRVARKKEKRWV